MTKKYLGQHFLFDPSILRRIAGVSGLTADDTVVEIGPGPGRLTKILAETAGRVIAIELDQSLHKRLEEELSGHNTVELVLGDALKFPYDRLGSFKVVANIPYYITTPLIFKLFEYRDRMVSMTVTIQKEVAERIVAKPGGKEYGVLTLAVQYYARPVLAFRVPKGAFRPVPKVDSAVVHMEVLKHPRVSVSDESLFFRVIRTAFSQRRKTLANSLKPLCTDIKERLPGAGIEPGRRPETLTIEEFATLAEVIRGCLKGRKGE